MLLSSYYHNTLNGIIIIVSNIKYYYDTIHIINDNEKSIALTISN